MELLAALAKCARSWGLAESKHVCKRKGYRLKAIVVLQLPVRNFQNTITHRLQCGTTTGLKGKPALIRMKSPAVQFDIYFEVVPQLIA